MWQPTGMLQQSHEGRWTAGWTLATLRGSQMLRFLLRLSLVSLTTRARHCGVPTAPPQLRSGLTYNSISTGKKGPSCHCQLKKVQKHNDWPRVGHVAWVRQPCFHQDGRLWER